MGVSTHCNYPHSFDFSAMFESECGELIVTCLTWPGAGWGRCADEVSHWTLVRCQLTQGGDTERREETGVINLLRWWQWIISASGYECAVLPITRWFEVTLGYLIDKTHHPPQPLYLIFNQPLAQSKLHHQRSCYLLRQELKKCCSSVPVQFEILELSIFIIKS